MSDSLRDQLLGLGYKPVVQKTPKPGSGKPDGRNRGRDSTRQPDRKPGRSSIQSKPTPHKADARRSGEMDLGKAYAIRAQTEKQERIEAERIKQEEARARREAREKLAELLAGNALNADNAEVARHFDYGGKIKRIHVTPEQLKALNAGELGVVQLNGRYLLVSADVLAQAEAIFPQSVALKVDPQAPATGESGGDARHQVPDDLVW